MPLYMYGATFLRVVGWVGSMAEQSRLNGIWRKKRTPLDLGRRFRVGLGKFGCFIKWGDGWVAKPHKKKYSMTEAGRQGCVQVKLHGRGGTQACTMPLWTVNISEALGISVSILCR